MIFHPKLQEEYKQVEGFWGKKKRIEEIFGKIE